MFSKEDGFVTPVNEDSFPNLDLDKIIKRFNNEDWEEV